MEKKKRKKIHYTHVQVTCRDHLPLPHSVDISFTYFQIIANNAELTYTVGEYSGTKVSQNLTINITRYMNGRTLTCFVYRQSETSTKVSATVTLDIDCTFVSFKFINFFASN